MPESILAGCDLHDKTMLLFIARGGEAPSKRTFRSDADGRKAMIAELKKRANEAGGARIFLAYEASGLGFGLHDELIDVGIQCFVLAPSKIKRSPHGRRNKTDEKDAMLLLETLRAHVLAGNTLPAIVVPTIEQRDDRELVRARLDAQDKSGAVKTQIRTLLKRYAISKPKEMQQNAWTRPYRAWLNGLRSDKRLGPGARANLASLLRQLQVLECEVETLDKQIKMLSQESRYADDVKELMKLDGPGLLTAMVFLTELGDLMRFKNRRQIAAFLGVTPAAHESGECDDRKGHITHQGPERVRFVLCQASWNRIRTDPHERLLYERIVKKNPKHKKIALVAVMRRLAIRMWHTVLNRRAAA